ncbi:MAG: C4-dicarboxylate ABC transporter substrate-binding protein [Spirochaetaceae bacterium]|nr:MAG: C4-dicarboxylate ABC transporter substrate-binding protein [Spirochaetaceae bacterium]
MKNTLFVFLMVALVATTSTVFAGGGAEAAPDDAVLTRTIQARLASEEIEGDFMTVWAEYFAEHMYDWSDGMFQLDVYPYGGLGDARDINELAQLGVVEYVFSDFAWKSAFVPEAAVFGLHYLWPRERIGEVMEWIAKNGDTMEVLEQAYRREGLVPLAIMYEGWQWITSNHRISSIDDLRGFNVRIMASDMLNAQYLALGASPTPMSYGEVYSGLQTGLIDGQINPLFAIRSMNFFEVQDYFTQIWAEPFVGIPTANMAFFDGLPEEVQQEHRDWWANAIVPAADWIDDVIERDLAEILERRPRIEVNVLDDDDLVPFQERALEAHERFKRTGGPLAEEVYNALVNDIDRAKAALGIN